ncbi:MAG: hypothetical protein EXR61_00065 [Chloroflexi bacterium]|nr:hypothetical protein [Chloroflexota bacterium]
MSLRYGTWVVEHPLPLGIGERAVVGQSVALGATIATGTVVRGAVRVSCARRLGVLPEDLRRVLRVAPGALITRGSVLARTGRRFPRAVTAPFDGRLVHVSAEGDLWLAPVVDRWLVRSTMAGRVVRATDAAVTVEGNAWSVRAMAAYGPDAIGTLAIGVAGPDQELSPHGLDVRLQGRILVGGARMAPEAVTRAHACGIAGLVAGAVPAAGLRVVYGDDATATGGTTRLDRPTLLCLAGFGAGPLPTEVFDPLLAFARSPAAIHVGTARLFVFAPADAAAAGREAPAIRLAADFLGVRAQRDVPTAIEHARFASEYEGQALSSPDGPIPRANVLPFDAVR